MVHKGSVNLQTKRLRLIPLGMQFLNSTHEYASDPDITRYMVHLPCFDISETKYFLDKVQAEWEKPIPQFYEFAIMLNNEHIGAVSIYLNEDHSEGELGWILCKQYWGNGYAVEAANELISFAKEKLKIKKVIAHCDSENTSSYRVMEKLGMILTCRTQGRRNKLSVDDRDDLMYTLEL